MSEEKFRRELASLLEKFPEQAKGFQVAELPSVSEGAEAAPQGGRCVRYGRNPQTGELVCLEYAT
jgi:hypothetical protein